MTLVQFVSRWVGYSATAPGGAGGQCVDLANLWLLALRLAPVRADAADWPLAVDHTAWLWTPNTRLGVPPAGALVVWRRDDRGAGTGPAGHIAIATPLADTDDLVSFDQDWPWKAPCALVLHRRYSGVAGWLTPRVGPLPPR